MRRLPCRALQGRIVAVHSGRGIEKHCPQVLFDVADFGGVLAHAGKDKFNVAAVKFHKPCLDKPCRIIVPGDTDSFSFSQTVSSMRVTISLMRSLSRRLSCMSMSYSILSLMISS